MSKVRLSLTRWSPPGVRKIAEQKQLGNLRELTPEAAALQQETLDCFACDDVKLANNPEILEADPDERAWAVKLSVQSLSNGMPLSTKNSRHTIKRNVLFFKLSHIIEPELIFYKNNFYRLYNTDEFFCI